MSFTESETWASCLHLVRQEVADDPEVQALLGALQPETLLSERLDVAAPADWTASMRNDLSGRLSRAASRAWGRPIDVRLVGPHDAGQLDLPFIRRAQTEPEEQVRLNPNYTFENLVVAENNRLAHAACVAVCEAPGQAYNPLFLHGTVGLGKSHLLQATCHRLLDRRRDAKILYLSCESFVNQFIAAVERGDLERFRYHYRHIDVLVIDDIHFLADKERTQEEFFHTFNTLYQSQKQVILSSDSAPQEIPHLEERLVSRFKWGLVARLDRPDFETRVAILGKKARQQGLELPDDILRYIAQTHDNNIRELEGAVTRVAAECRFAGAQLTVDMVRGLLADTAPKSAREITVTEIIDAVVARYSVRVSELQSKKRSRSVALPRQVAMYLARRLTDLSLEEIGGYFGGRDHTTVLHAERKIAQDLAADEDIKATIAALTAQIRSGAAPLEINR
jgi:chromosomal replication initiator protein